MLFICDIHLLAVLLGHTTPRIFNINQYKYIMKTPEINSVTTLTLARAKLLVFVITIVLTVLLNVIF